MKKFYRSKLLKAYGGCIHGVSVKDRRMPYEGSLALHTGEAPDTIRVNRKTAASYLGLDNGYAVVMADQTHSDRIEIISIKQSRGWEALEDAVADCDALITDVKGVALGILTADCVPILLFDPVREVIACVHAGWRGTKSGITFKTVCKMQECFGCHPETIIAYVGPSIGRCCYEVGEDVAGHFSGWFTFDRQRDKYMLDLPMANEHQLLEAGLLGKHIEQSGLCTACETEHFFSYRKEDGCTGRFVSMIALRPISL